MNKAQITHAFMNTDIPNVAFVSVGLLGLSAVLLLNGCAERSAVQAESREIALTEGEGFNYGPCFSPDGKLIAYSSSPKKGEAAVHVISATGGDPIKARRMRDFCLATGISMLVMETGGSVLSDTVAAHLSQSIPAPSCLGTWSCQEMVSVDPAPGQGARNVDGCFSAPSLVGLGVEPDLAVLGEPVAVYRI